MKRAYFAAGCFWCITPVFVSTAGVLSVKAGYCGGEEAFPCYEDVKAQKTHHRETICVEYDENRISYGELLDLFFQNVDLTDAEGQFVDRGYSYTLAVYYHSYGELEAASFCMDVFERKLGIRPCVALEEFGTFYDAEEYHQLYYEKYPESFEKELLESGRRKAKNTWFYKENGK